ncbi:MAG: DnaJ domain-containing protein [Magnetococcales bacterium]|nr:DnaJ domain-containing protein [Magnetococcales bacterium]
MSRFPAAPLSSDPVSATPLGGRLLGILAAHPEGVREYDLVKRLQKEGVSPFAGCLLSDELSLFRTHFFLFHQLYLLQGQLRRERCGDLEIHCLGIVLRPWREGDSAAVEILDPLREYYLDTTHLEETTREQVIGMLAGFWRRLDRWERQDSARAVLGVAREADPDAIRRRYRELSLLHHPDRGGEPERFRAIAEAAEILLKVPAGP